MFLWIHDLQQNPNSLTLSFSGSYSYICNKSNNSCELNKTSNIHEEPQECISTIVSPFSCLVLVMYNKGHAGKHSYK